MESLRETKQRYDGGGLSSAEHLIRLQLRCQDVAGDAKERTLLPIVGQQCFDKLREMKDESASKRFQERDMKQPKLNTTATSKSQRQQKQRQPVSDSSSTRRRPAQHSTNQHVLSSATSLASGPVSPLQQMQQLHHSTVSINGHCHTFGSSRSTATDSSGFSSSASTNSCYGPPQTMSPLSNGDFRLRDACESQETRTSLIRSRLIEDLNQLEKIAAAALEAKARRESRELNQHNQVISSEGSQTQLSPRSLVDGGSRSHSNKTTPSTTLSRTTATTSDFVELGYSTLCRDEFSSFIDYKSEANATMHDHLNHQQAHAGSPDKQSEKGARASTLETAARSARMSARGQRCSSAPRQQQRRRKAPSGGPMLVGVHECETPLDSDCIVSPGSCTSSSNSSPVESSSQPAFERSTMSSDEQEENSLTKVDSYDEDHDDRELICHEISEDEANAIRANQDQDQLAARLRKHLAEPQCEAHVEENFSEDEDNDANNNINNNNNNHHHVSDFDVDRRQPAYDLMRAKPRTESRPASRHDLDLKLLNKNDRERLSGMIDVYLSRVESLLKLANGDKSVSLDELLDGSATSACRRGDAQAAEQLLVSDEFRTSIVYVPVSECPPAKPEVVQEIEMVIEDDERSDDYFDDDYDDNSNVDRDRLIHNIETVTTNLGSNFAALLSSPQTSAILNWRPRRVEVDLDNLLHGIIATNEQQRSRHLIDQHQCRLLERSFLDRWLEVCAQEEERDCPSNQSDTTNYKCESLVKIIRSHMSEFAARYNAYQESMRRETSFAVDWRENWLFATSARKCLPLKRTHQLSDFHRPPLSSNDPFNEAENEHQAPQEIMNMKRAKMMSSTTLETSELLSYSTLLINKYKPVKVTFVEGNEMDDDECESGATTKTTTTTKQGQRNKYKQQIDICYEQQPDYSSELQQTFLELSGQVNVCQLFLNDSFASDCDTVDCDEIRLLGANQRRRTKRSLEIEYESSLNAARSLIDGQLLCFRSFGHLFELRKLRHFESFATSVKRRRRLEALKKLILARLCSACHWRAPTAKTGPSMICGDDGGDDRRREQAKLAHMASWMPLELLQQDQARFLVGITNVQLSQALPVIQFCAKVAGALPIRVGWYRLLEDGSEQELTAHKLVVESRAGARKNLVTTTTTAGDQDEWPLTMRANYELEYQTDWLSRYKFKRERGDILFEIRRAHPERDYGQTFKCVVENYCSVKECEFTLELKRREPNEKLIKRAAQSGGRQAHAERPASKTKTQRANQCGPASNSNSNQSGRVADDFGRARLNRVEPSSENQEAGQAILRTWSQRTLNKRAPLVDHNDGQQHHHQQQQQQADYDATAHLSAHGAAGHLQLQTVGRLSAQAMNDCKFGTDYPYHPVSLMRRLEENKMSLTLRSRLRLAARRPTGDDHSGELSVSITSGARKDDHDDDDESDGDNKAVAAPSLTKLARSHRQHNQQANQESELNDSSASTSSNLSEVGICGGKLDVRRGAATFMRPSHRQLISNKALQEENDDRQLVLVDERSDQPTDRPDQQRSAEYCDRQRDDCQTDQTNIDRPEPRPRPRQRPAASYVPPVNDDKLTPGRTPVAVSKLTSPESIENSESDHWQARVLPKSRSSSSSISISNSKRHIIDKNSVGQSYVAADNGNDANHQSFGRDYPCPSLPNNRPVNGCADSYQNQAFVNQSANSDGNDLRAPLHPLQSQATIACDNSRRIQSQTRLEDKNNVVSKQSKRPSADSDQSRQGMSSSNEKRKDSSEAKPKSVRSLISRFNGSSS